MLSLLAAAPKEVPLVVQDLPLIAAGIFVPLVLAGIFVFARRLFSSPAIRDVLGISAAFVVLVGLGWLMIVGEHALG